MAHWSLQGKSALVIDDFADMRSMLRTVLQSLDCEDIKMAKNATEALAMITNHYFDVILCDYNLGEGDKDGQQVLEEAKFREILPFSTVFMMITAEINAQMVMGVMDYKPDDYIQKPITKSVLQTRLKKLLTRKSALSDISHALDNKSKDYALALELCNEKLAENVGPTFELKKLKGELLIRLGDYKAAIEHCRDVYDERLNPSIGLLLGQALFQDNQLYEAEDIFNELLDNNSNFTLAYDWLAKIKAQQGEFKKAQALLEEAIKVSPKAILRQRVLGEICYQSEDYEGSEKAYKQAVLLGEHSCYRSPVDYSGLANSLGKNNQPTEALKAVAALKKTFPRDDSVAVQAAVMESRFYKDMGRETLSKKSIESAYQLFQKRPDVVPTELAVDLAETCLAMGQTDQAKVLVQHAVRSQHDDEAALDKVKEAFAQHGMAEEADILITNANNEVRDINNRGVQLAKEGKLDESIELFMEAARAMPHKTVINLNAARSLIMKMRQHGGSDRQALDQIRTYLSRVEAINPKHPKLLELQAALSGLA